MQTFEQFLEEHFVGMGVHGNIPINKDNLEDLFVDWFGNLQMDEIIAFADLWMDYFKRDLMKTVDKLTVALTVK